MRLESGRKYSENKTKKKLTGSGPINKRAAAIGAHNVMVRAREYRPSGLQYYKRGGMRGGRAYIPALPSRPLSGRVPALIPSGSATLPAPRSGSVSGRYGASIAGIKKGPLLGALGVTTRLGL